MKMTSINNRMDSNLTGMWVNFFTAAGIPSDVSATYALTFAENRIQNDMLLDLNKEYLRDMGITRMGDVIAILRHAKMVHESTARDKVLSTTGANKVPVAAVTGRTTTSQPSSPASRILEHYTRNPVQDTSPPKRKLTDSGVNTSETEIKKSRLIRFGAKPQVAVSERTSNKQTVFARLGNADTQKTIVNTTVKTEVRPIFSRLGSKQDTDQVLPVPKDALKYEGILKSPPVIQKSVKVTTTKNNVRRIAMECTMRADEEPISVKEKLLLPNAAKIAPPKAVLPVTSAKSVKFANRVEYKEIEAIKKPKFTPVFNKPERRLSMPEVSDVKARLGTPKDTNVGKNVNMVKNANNLTITRNVFNRLGV